MKNTDSKIMVIGSGTWGTALANHLAINNCEVYLNSIEKDVAISNDGLFIGTSFIVKYPQKYWSSAMYLPYCGCFNC